MDVLKSILPRPGSVFDRYVLDCKDGYFTVVSDFSTELFFFIAMPDALAGPQGSTCQACPESNLLLIPVAIAALVGIGLVLKLIWKVSAVQLSDGDGKTGRDVADAEDAKGAAATTADSIARISNTAIVSSIAFPAIFQISITFTMPFGFPPGARAGARAGAGAGA